MLRCPQCGSTNVESWSYDFGVCPETGYHDAGERGACLSCGCDAELVDFQTAARGR